VLKVTTSREPFFLRAYAPGWHPDDERPLRVVEAMEGGLPGLRLPWAISDEGTLIPVAGAERGRRQATDGSFPLLCNGNENHLVTIFLMEAPHFGREMELEVHAKWPMDDVGVAAAAQTLEGVAQAAHSYWAQVTPRTAAREIGAQTSPWQGGPPKPPRGLPVLKSLKGMRPPKIPSHLGWLNYWSPDSAQVLGFPDPERDAEWLSRAKRTETGGWLLRLTDAPLNLDNPNHLDTLLRAYERFPEIGGRVPSLSRRP